MKTAKLRLGQTLPPGEWDEVIYAVNAWTKDDPPRGPRIALPVYTKEEDFNKLRVLVKRLLRQGFDKFEAADLAGLRMLKSLGVEDVTADWTLYAFNSWALKALSGMGVRRFVASPENTPENLAFLRESGYAVETLAQQSTPLFISLTRPEEQTELAVFERDGLYVTTKRVPRTWEGGTRYDFSWDPPTEDAK